MLKQRQSITLNNTTSTELTAAYLDAVAISVSLLELNSDLIGERRFSTKPRHHGSMHFGHLTHISPQTAVAHDGCIRADEDSPSSATTPQLRQRGHGSSRVFRTPTMA
jgi:hypothetical protein